MGFLVIRNLSSIHVTLKRIKQCESNGVQAKSTFTSLFKTKSAKTIFQNGDDIRREHAVEVELHPFQTHKTEITVLPGQDIAVTLSDTSGETWTVILPSKEHKSTAMISDSAEDLLTIYNESSSAITLFDKPNPRTWMNQFPDSTPLSALSIPGTHNSPTYHPALPSVRCQAVSPLLQLENGIRFFDVRVQVNEPDKGADSDSLELVHAVFPISFKRSIKARDLFAEIYAFLSRNPSETLILSLKREGRGSGTDGIFSQRLRKQFTTPNSQYWYTGSHVPTLGAVRGKIVLLRRFHLSEAEALQEEFYGTAGFGIDATNWADNTSNHHGGEIQIQDFYEVTQTENIDKKIRYVCEHFERAGAVVHPLHPHSTSRRSPPLFINFTSASNFWKPGCWPEKIAAKLNPAVLRFLCEGHEVREGDGGLGVVVCDWVGEGGEWDLVRVVVGMNARLLVRMREGGSEVDEEREDIGGGGGRGGRGRRGGGRRGRGGRMRGGDVLRGDEVE